ncbi:MAG: transglycosylase SLT domain-containing protein [Terracidiphilus sp.]
MPGKFNIFNSVGRSGRNLFGDVTIIQRLINLKIPKRPIEVDGLCGSATISAIEAVQRHHLLMKRPTGKVEPNDSTFDFLARDIAPEALGDEQIAWGARVSAAFKAKLIQIARNIGVDPNFLISAIAFETGESFSPSIKNASGATGLIQFTPATAAELGTTTDDLAAMSAENQMDYVEKYFDPYRNILETIEDVYMAILWPAAIGKANSWVLFSRPSPQYDRNSGLDTDKDGNVTKEEAAAMVRAKLRKGRGAGYFG